MTEPNKNIDAVRVAVMAHFMSTGKPARIEDIAKRMDCAPSTIRRYIDQVHHFIPGVERVQVEVPKFSKSYKMYQVGVTYAVAYEPTKSELVKIIKQQEEHIQSAMG